MRTVAVILAAAGVAILSGCTGKAPPVTDGKVRIDVENTLETSDSRCVRLRLSFRGQKTVYVRQQGDSESAGIPPDAKSGIASCSVVILADGFDSSDGPRLKWLHQIQGQGIVAGGPSILPVDQAHTIDEFVKIGLSSGEYDIGKEIAIAEINGDTLTLRVE